MLPELFGHINNENFVGPFKCLDTGRDHAHPGPKSHKVMADLYWNKMLDSEFISKFNGTIACEPE